MGKLGLSASQIGQQIGASAMEVNRLLKDQGFLDGEYGAYGLTDKGKQYGFHRFHDNGYGGAALRNWDTTHFDPSIVAALDSGPEQLAKVRADITAHKEALKAAGVVARAEAEAMYQAFLAKKDAAGIQYGVDPRKVLIVLAGGLVVTGAVLAVSKGVQRYQHKRVEVVERAALAASSEPNSAGTSGQGVED